MSSRIPVVYVNIRVFSHATEEVDKVLKAVRNALPAKFSDQIVLEKTDLRGHYRNPIVLLETKVRKRDIVEAIFQKIASSLSSLDKERLSTEIGQHVSKGNLFIRLDKQSAYLSKLKLCSRDPIHFQIHFRESRLDEIVEVCRRFGMLL